MKWQPTIFTAFYFYLIYTVFLHIIHIYTLDVIVDIFSIGFQVIQGVFYSFKAGQKSGVGDNWGHMHTCT